MTSLLGTLTEEQIQWANSGLNRTAAEQLIDYLQSCGTFVAERIGNCVVDTDFALLAFDALMEGDEIDYINKVIIDPTFINSETECIHNLLKSNANFYRDMLSKFNNVTRGALKLKIGATTNGDWGTTEGDYDSENEYTITTSNTIENSTNLMRMVTLSHELIHAYMFSTLENWGLITIDVNGDPILNLNCVNATNYNSINLKSLNPQDRFTAIICAFQQNNTLSVQWTHDLFNSWTFDVNTYRDKLETLLINEHDWDGENTTFKNDAINVFGATDWKQEVAKAVSYIGLEGTQEYNNYINGYSTNINKFIYISNIRTKVQSAKANCI